MIVQFVLGLLLKNRPSLSVKPVTVGRTPVTYLDITEECSVREREWGYFSKGHPKIVTLKEIEEVRGIATFMHRDH